MDPNLRAEVIQHDLGHKVQDFDKIGVKTFKDMSFVRDRDLTEELLFDYAERRKFDDLRATCIKKVKGQQEKFDGTEVVKILEKPTTITPNKVEGEKIFSETGAEQTNGSNPLAEKDFYEKRVLLEPPSIHDSSLGNEISFLNPIVGDTFEMFYPLQQKPRGLGLIFVNEKITGQSDRIGGDKDEENLRLLFEQMALTPIVYKDMSCEEIRQSIIETTQTDFSQCEMLAVAISTHGGEGDKLFGSDGTTYSLYRDVVSLFKPNSCPGLSGKPKVFFIQSCRGDEVGSCPIQADGLERPCVTLESDFLVAHSTVLGYKSFRHTQTGSWFVTTVREMFEKYKGKHSLMDILTFVNQIVIQKSLTESGDSDKFIQTCQLESTLTKLMRFDN